MRKLFLVAAIALVMSSCGGVGKTTQETSADSTAVDSVVVDSTAVDSVVVANDSCEC